MRSSPRIPSVKAAVSQGFTLIELLVVITIIGILAGLLLPVANRVIENARKVTAKSALVTVVNAVKNYQAEYGSYPVLPAAGTTTPVDTTFDSDGSGAGNNSQLCFVLRALNSSTTAGVTSTDAAYTALNARRIVYLEYKDAKNPAVPKDGFVVAPSGNSTATPQDLNGKTLKVGDLIDPWGDMYGFRLDTGYSDKVVDPYQVGATATGAGDQSDDASSQDNTLVHTSVIGWSLGKDHKMATTSATFDASGNVASWR